MRPVAHLPLILGILRRLAGATRIDRLIHPTRRMWSHVAVGAQLWCWLAWTGSMRSLRQTALSHAGVTTPAMAAGITDVSCPATALDATQAAWASLTCAQTSHRAVVR